jgi:hypothetical protein
MDPNYPALIVHGHRSKTVIIQKFQERGHTQILDPINVPNCFKWGLHFISVRSNDAAESEADRVELSLVFYRVFAERDAVTIYSSMYFFAPISVDQE